MFHLELKLLEAGRGNDLQLCHGYDLITQNTSEWDDGKHSTSAPYLTSESVSLQE